MEAPSDALLCPITLQLFRDPVIAQDGHTYEREPIEKWIQKNGTSPITNQKLSLEHLIPNHAIKKMIDEFENSSREKKFQYTLDVDVKKKKGRPLFQAFGKTIYHAGWLPTNDGRPDVVLLKIDGARANKEASFYVDMSRHPHIVRTFGLVRDGDDNENSIMLLQECASEGSLYELLCERKKPLDEKFLLQIFLQIIDAMSYLAVNNIVHGDLACRNVLVFRFDENDPKNIIVKVTDFGLSRHSKIYTQVATVSRTTLSFIPIRSSAPEILSANVTANDYTEKSDVYAMGVLMWEAYSRGAVPWTNIQSEDDVIRQVRNGDILPQPINCSPQYWNIITKTWSQLPSQRPTFDQLKKLFMEQLYQTTMSASERSKEAEDKRFYLGMPSSKPPLVPLNYQAKPPENLTMGNHDSRPVNPQIPGSSGVNNRNPLSGRLDDSRSTPGFYRPTDPNPVPQPISTVPSYFTPTASTPVPPENSAGPVSVKKDQMNLVGQTITYNQQKCRVKGRIICHDKELYALENEKSIRGYNGLCPNCGIPHVYFDKPDRGYYIFVKTIDDIINDDKLAAERTKGPKQIQRLSMEPPSLQPLDHPVLGRDKGIEGNSNSGYMDSTIFCMFAYSSVFDSLLHMEVDSKGDKKQTIKKLQKLLRENIVNVLRSDAGFVERDALYHLRALLSKATGDPSFIEMEKDPSEFLRALETLFRYAPLKTIPPDQPPNETQSNITTNIIWEMFDANQEKRKWTSVASIFLNSLTEIPAKLATIPPFLILVAPRHTRSQRSYPYIIPDREIILDHKIVQHVCLQCKQTNHDSDQSCDFYFCKECYSKESDLSLTPLADDIVMCYCHGCLEKLHKRLPIEECYEHYPKRMDNVTHKLKLFAVLCVEISHYVAFVKCHKQDQQDEWVFFDSMSDRLSNEKNVPRVSRVRDFSQWIGNAEKDKYFFPNLDRRRDSGRPTSQEFNEDEMRQIRLFRDGAFFFYENSEANYQ